MEAPALALVAHGHEISSGPRIRDAQGVFEVGYVVERTKEHVNALGRIVHGEELDLAEPEGEDGSGKRFKRRGHVSVGAGDHPPLPAVHAQRLDALQRRRVRQLHVRNHIDPPEVTEGRQFFQKLAGRQRLARAHHKPGLVAIALKGRHEVEALEPASCTVAFGPEDRVEAERQRRFSVEVDPKGPEPDRQVLDHFTHCRKAGDPQALLFLGPDGSQKPLSEKKLVGAGRAVRDITLRDRTGARHARSVQTPQAMKLTGVRDIYPGQHHPYVQMMVRTERQTLIVAHARQHVTAVQRRTVQSDFAQLPQQLVDIARLPEVGLQPSGLFIEFDPAGMAAMRTVLRGHALQLVFEPGGDREVVVVMDRDVEAARVVGDQVARFRYRRLIERMDLDVERRERLAQGRRLQARRFLRSVLADPDLEILNRLCCEALQAMGEMLRAVWTISGRDGHRDGRTEHVGTRIVRITEWTWPEDRTIRQEGFLVAVGETAPHPGLRRRMAFVQHPVGLMVVDPLAVSAQPLAEIVVLATIVEVPGVEPADFYDRRAAEDVAAPLSPAWAEALAARPAVFVLKIRCL